MVILESAATNNYESICDAGAAISSEQSGEMLHSRLQRVWDLRIKTRADNSLVDCMVTYNVSSSYYLPHIVLHCPITHSR